MGFVQGCRGCPRSRRRCSCMRRCWCMWRFAGWPRVTRRRARRPGGSSRRGGSVRRCRGWPRSFGLHRARRGRSGREAIRRCRGLRLVPGAGCGVRAGPGDGPRAQQGAGTSAALPGVLLAHREAGCGARPPAGPHPLDRGPGRLRAAGAATARGRRGPRMRRDGAPGSCGGGLGDDCRGVRGRLVGADRHVCAPSPTAVAVASPLIACGRHVGDVVVRVVRPQFVSVYLILARPGRLTCQLLRSGGSVTATEPYDASDMSDRGASPARRGRSRGSESATLQVMSWVQAHCRARDNRRSVDRHTAGWRTRPARRCPTGPDATTPRRDRLSSLGSVVSRRLRA